MAKDPETRAHRAWLGLLQPVGLVVSPPALVEAQAVVARNPAGLQKRLRGLLEPDPKGRLRLNDFPRFTRALLGWEPEDLVPGETLEGTLEVVLPEHQEVLRPSYAVPDLDHEGDGRKWLMLVQQWPVGTDLDAAPPRDRRGWHASPQIRLERLLRDTEVPLGLLCTPEAIRLVYAPVGESSGHLTFPVEAMAEVGGRPILAALHMLLGAERVFTLPPARRLNAILSESRKYQNVVSTKLAEQVLRALGELLRGFQAADEARDGLLLGDVVREDPQHVYGGLITVLMRLVFLLYAEEREMLPDDTVYVKHYSVGGLFEKLRADAGMYPDTMDQRYGAWARLLSLFRLVFDGGGHGGMRLPTRHGQLFHPDEYPFLEGRLGGAAQPAAAGEPLDPPRVSDGVVYRVLEDLLMLDGERLSYRSLDVEQIGSVYEAVMGFEVKRAMGASIGVRPQHVVVDLDGVLKKKGKARVDAFDKDAACKLGKAASKEIKEAKTVDDVVAALGKKVSPQTPRVLPPGSLYLQPTEERRRSGSHYTPRSLTEPIVRTTLRPVLEGLGEKPKAEQILGLKVCDPAMGSGAFLVEACRHLAQKVVDAWDVHGDAPEIPADEDALLHARRLVAQRCLYGVDKNPFAVNLAKLSLWLVTLAKDHAFTFLDHALKYGDSLVGLTRRQIAAFHWNVPEEADDDLPLFRWVNEQVGKASAAREEITALGDGREEKKRFRLREAAEALEEAQMRGDTIITAFFSGKTTRQREENRSLGVSTLENLSSPVRPFHWELEFGEIFSRDNPGFDAIVGNPPFLGGGKIRSALGAQYVDWLTSTNSMAHGNSDISAYFLRSSFEHIRNSGTVGFLSTNTSRQGDTRTTGLGWIRARHGQIFEANRRIRWPGQAAVIACAVHIQKSPTAPKVRRLDERVVPMITAFLSHTGGDEPPVRLAHNSNISFIGCKVSAPKMIFDDMKTNTSSLEDMRRLLRADIRNSERITPYFGGIDITSSHDQSPRRYVANFHQMSLQEASRWPTLLNYLETHVKPYREVGRLSSIPWWQFERPRPALYAAMNPLDRIIAGSQTGKYLIFTFMPTSYTYDQKAVVIVLDDNASLAVISSRIHGLWSDFFGSSMKDDPVYTPTDCFETFPFPLSWRGIPSLVSSGKSVLYYRQKTMKNNEEGLTATYNRFHDPDESSPDILELRDIHDQMDRAVLDVYGWTDIQPKCEFLLDYEEDEDDESSSRRRKPWRYRWPDEIQEEVLARLLDLNQKRAEEERLAGLTADEDKDKETKSRKKRTPSGKDSKKSATKKAGTRKTSKKKASTTDHDDGWKSTKKKSKKTSKRQTSLPLGGDSD